MFDRELKLFLSVGVLCLASYAEAMPSLPRPTDVPAPPTRVMSPGGAKLPNTFAAEPAVDAPAISAISETTFPDETLVVTGENLDGAELVVWSEAKTAIVKPLRSETNKMLAVLPPDTPISTLLVWPVRSNHAGRPIRVNGASAWWLWPPVVRASDAEQTLKIIGKNLALDGSKPLVALTGPDGTSALAPSLVEPYQLQVPLPSDLAPGDYFVQTHNGTGGKFGWSEPLALQIAGAEPVSKYVCRPEDFGAQADDDGDDLEGIQKAVDAAAAAGGGRVVFGAGVYAVSGPIRMLGNHVTLEGIGSGAYAPANDSVTGEATCIRRLDKTDLELPEAIVILEGENCGLRNLALRNNHNGNRQNVVRVTGRNAVLSKLLLTMFDKRDWGRDALGPPEVSDAELLLPEETDLKPVEPGLLAAWDFEQEGRHIDDSSGHGNVGTLHGVRVEGAFGKAVRFPYRSQARVLGPRLEPDQALSISAWFLSDMDDYEPIRTIVRKDMSYALRFADGRLGFLLWSGGKVHVLCSPKVTWPNGEWHHHCATFDGQNMKLYLDGKAWAKCVLPEPIRPDKGDDFLYIGGRGSRSLRGVLDRVHIYSRALSPEQIRAEFANTRAGRETGEFSKSTYVGFANPAHRVGLLNTGAIQIHTKGSAQAQVLDCHIHCVGPGVEISPNIFTRARMNPENPEPMEPSTDDVLVQRCTIRGYYGGEPDRLPDAGASGRTVGVVIHNGKRIIVEHCNFAGANRYKRRILNRTVLSLNTGNRWLYFAHNASRNVGSDRSATGIDRNQGEQYLVHYRYVPGGLFHVISSTDTETIIDTKNLSVHQNEPGYQSRAFLWNPLGSKVPAEVGKNGHWTLFISKGRGAGQYRQIASRKDGQGRVVLMLQKPWRVPPDATSRVHLVPLHRNMILYANTVDSGKQVLTDKTHGVTFWYWTFDTIVADNTFRNLTAGVVYNSRYTGPVGWNLIRGNVIEHMWGYTGDTSQKATLYVDHFRSHKSWAAPEDRVWYSVGNICRGNRGKDSAVAAFLHRRPSTSVLKLVSGPETDSGIVLSVLENNVVKDTEEGIVISAPTNCCLLRNNTVKTRNGTKSVIDVSPGMTDCMILP